MHGNVKMYTILKANKNTSRDILDKKKKVFILVIQCSYFIISVKLSNLSYHIIPIHSGVARN